MGLNTVNIGKIITLAISISLTAGCSGGSTASGIPSSCQKSGNEYFRYAALQIRGSMVQQEEKNFAYSFPQSDMRVAGASINTWLEKNPECNVGAVADLAKLLDSINSQEFTFAQVSMIQQVHDAGKNAAEALGVDVPFDPSSPTSDALDPDELPRPSDVVAKKMPFDSDLMISLIDLMNAS